MYHVTPATAARDRRSCRGNMPTGGLSRRALLVTTLLLALCSFSLGISSVSYSPLNKPSARPSRDGPLHHGHTRFGRHRLEKEGSDLLRQNGDSVGLATLRGGGNQCRRVDRMISWFLGLLLVLLLLVPSVAHGASTASNSQSLILSSDSWSLWAVLLAASAGGIRAEKTAFGAALSSPLVTMFGTLLLVNAGVLPSSAPIYSSINSFLVPLVR